MNHLIKLNDIRFRNTLSLLRVLMNRGSLSRIELARESGCDNTTVTRAVRELQSRGLVLSAGKTETAHGRPRERLMVDASAACLIGLSLEPYGIRGALTDLRGRPLIQERQFFGERRTLKEYLEALEGIYSRLLHEVPSTLAGIGVSTFGTSLDPEGGILSQAANFPELQGFRLREYFARQCHCQPYFSDMMLCRMHYELDRHPECRNGNTLLIHLGDGIGLCMASNGSVIGSRNQHGGEFGHNICELDGIPCACGRRGCLETRCSSHALLQEARRALRRPDMGFRDFARKYASGHSGAVKVVSNGIRYLSAALANQINNFSPDTVVFVGEQCEFGPAYFAALEEATRALLFEYTGNAVTFAYREPEECGAQGAALMAADRLMADADAFDRACPRQD